VTHQEKKKKKTNKLPIQRFAILILFPSIHERGDAMIRTDVEDFSSEGS